MRAQDKKRVPDQRTSTRIYLWLMGDSFIQSIRKIDLLKHMKGNTVIEMRALSCLESREQPFTLKFNLLSSLLGVKAKTKTNIISSFLWIWLTWVRTQFIKVFSRSKWSTWGGMHILALCSTGNISRGYVGLAVQCTLEVRLFLSINLQSLLLLWVCIWNVLRVQNPDILKKTSEPYLRHNHGL